MQVVISKTPENFKSVFDSVKNNKYYLILTAVLLLGMFCGAFSVGLVSDDVRLNLSNSVLSFITDCRSASFARLFFRSFLTGTVFITVIALFSFGVGGVVCLPIFQFLRGFGLCAVSGILYRCFSLMGMAFSILVLLPAGLAAAMILLSLSADGFKLSVRFFEGVRNISTSGTELRPAALLFLSKTLKSYVLYIFTSLTEAVFIFCFIKYFTF